MRILIATSHFCFVGGIEAYLEHLVPCLIEKGHEVAILHEWPNLGGRTIIGLANRHVEHFCVSESGVEKSLSAVASWDPDVVFNNGLSDTNLESKLTKQWPVFFYCHAVYGTCLSGEKAWKWPKPQICNDSMGLKCLFRYPVNRCGGRNPFRLVSLYKKTRQRLRLLRSYKKIMVASQWMSDLLIQNGINQTQVSILPLFPLSTKRSIEPPVFRPWSNQVLFVGRLVENKGWKHAIDATAIAEKMLSRSIKIIIVGKGPDFSLVESYCRSKAVSVEILGNLTPNQLEMVKMESDLLLVPSLCGEGFGLVGIEAGSLGLPAAGYAVAGIKDWLIPGVTGEAGGEREMDSGQLAKAIFRSLSDHAHWQKLRTGAWEKSGEFTLEKHINLLEQILIGRF